MSDFSNLTSDSFVYWSTDTKQFTVFYVKDSDALTALKDKRTSGHPCAYAAAGEGAEVLNCEKGKLATVSKIDGIFDGWYEKADYSGNKVTDAANNQSYYANWVECKHDNTKAYTASGNVITETCHDCGHVFGTATLTLPVSASKDAKVPGVVMLHGTGSNRDEAGMGYALAAPRMAADGIATLRIDFMGNGDSTASYRDYNYTSAVIEKSDESVSIIGL